MTVCWWSPSSQAAQPRATIYTADQCSAATSCFVIFYNSRNSHGEYRSPCFVTNKSEYSHAGRSIVQGTEVLTYRYQFGYDRQLERWPAICVGATPGSGLSVKNDAATAVNFDSRAHRVYYNTGYRGTSQDFPPSDNLKPALKNDNASSRRL
ncbi:hypothetical protein [Streptomyces triticirhizae]|uniref:Uncharacterized protein n=1 Tax=Streptomyces triticirhizae TaxID=2483353 RepID=A0A3M2MC91_9ACTN|nr:hypothetical protein [Streptomyces triticirhizae]RMI44818.1 hypothetical protein EBN88_04350 [Streptomyces triticirhizae]